MNYTELSEELCGVQIRHAEAANRLMSVLSVNGEDGVLLWMLSQQEEIYPSDISEHFGLTTGRVANVLRALERKASVVRVQDKEDLRRFRIELTDSGQQEAERLSHDVLGQHEEILREIGMEDAESMVSLMKRILPALERKKADSIGT